jgi:type II secretory pathway pseudopilin PulG
LLIVIAIAIAVMAITVPAYRALSAQNRRAACSANLRAIGQALALFREDFQSFPPDGIEHLWTDDALEWYRSYYGADPPGDHSEATLIGAAYYEDGTPIVTGVRGMGLFTLYYLGAYSAQLPPISSEPRIYGDLRYNLEMNGEGLNGLSWFRGSGYITKLETFHCPSSRGSLVWENLVLRTKLPELKDREGSAWNSYDLYYRRNYWNQGTRVLPILGYDETGNPIRENRHLLQPYPASDTVVTWCPNHRGSSPPAGPGVASTPSAGDQDLVLYADGSVRRMAAQPANRMYMEPVGTGWPEVPLM